MFCRRRGIVSDIGARRAGVLEPAGCGAGVFIPRQAGACPGHPAAEELLGIMMRRYEQASTMLTSNRPVEDWSKLLGDAAAVSAMLDRVLHHGHVLKCGPRSWRTKTEL